MSLSHVEPELSEAYITRSKADSARMKHLVETGDRRAKIFLSSVMLGGLARIVFVLTAALASGDVVLGGLVIFLAVMHNKAFIQVEANLFHSRWKKNLGGLLVNLMVFGGILYASKDAFSDVSFTASLVVVTFLTSWTLWLTNYNHMTGRSLRTGK